MKKTEVCSSCKRKKGTKVYKNIGILILVLGFIGGIVLGNLYEQKVLVYESRYGLEYNEYDYIFNWVVMLISWVSTSLFSIFIFAIGSICYRLDLIIDKDGK